TESQRLLIKFRENTTDSKLAQTFSSSGIRVTKAFSALNKLYLTEILPGRDIKNIVKNLRANPDILYVELDRQIFFHATTPNDSLFSEQWSLNNTGLPNATADADLNAPEAWDITTGSPEVVLAVIDSGVDHTHLDLKDNMWVNPNEIPGNGIDDDNNGYIDDINGIDPGEGDSDPMDVVGHGTHVAGIIAARGNNAIGISGVNWNTKILACKIDDAGFISLSAAIECLDYILDLKQNHGINIVASNASWGWIGDASEAMAEAIQQQLNQGILFVAAAGNSSSDNDVISHYPAGYTHPNVISVAATDQNDELTFFSNYGRHTVHISAPGMDIPSTVPGPAFDTNVIENPHTDIFFEDAETMVTSLIAQTPWATTSTDAFNGGSSWSDSPNADYINNLDTSLTSPTIDLSTYTGQEIYLAFFTKYDFEYFFDNLLVEMSGDNGLTWHTTRKLTGSSESSWRYYEFLVPEKLKNASFQFRFRVVTDDSVVNTGVLLDNIGLGTGPAVYASQRIEVHSGTSMASPHVTGMLGLLKAQEPTRSWSQLRNLVIAGGTPLAQLEENTISGRRLRAWDANGQGSMTCNNQNVLAKLSPIRNTVEIENGGNDVIGVAYLHINCDAPAGNLTATIRETGSSISLLDNGSGFDQAANDGIYSAYIDINNIARQNITVLLPDNTELNIVKRNNYSWDENANYVWRDIRSINNPLPVLRDDAGSAFRSPFAIHFGDDATGYDIIYVDDNGFISMVRGNEDLEIPLWTFINRELPEKSSTRLIAPLWQDLLPGSTFSISWGVVGNAPNRELVVQWDGVTTFFGQDTYAFQTVFFENSSDVLFNYKDVTGENEFVDAGARATVGLQIAPTIGSTFSYNTPNLSDEKAILWSTNGVCCGRSFDDRGGGAVSMGTLAYLLIIVLLMLNTTQLRRLNVLFLRAQIK
ncbi:S8 family serine peptidase, partial [Kaarinaea lacus]